MAEGSKEEVFLRSKGKSHAGNRDFCIYLFIHSDPVLRVLCQCLVNSFK